MPTTQTALWIFCEFASLTLVAAVATHAARAVWPALLAGGALAALVLAAAAPDPAWCALPVGAVALWPLLSRPHPRWLALAAGACAAISTAVHCRAGLPVLPAAVLALAPLSACWQLARARPQYADPQLREQAFGGLTCGAPLLAAAPTLASGWSSATALNRTPVDTALAMPPWTWLLAGLALGLGLFYGWWTNR